MDITVISKSPRNLIIEVKFFERVRDWREDLVFPQLYVILSISSCKLIRYSFSPV